MLDLEILPEKSISSEKWQLILGMSFYQVIQILKSNCEAIKTVQLIYNDKVTGRQRSETNAIIPSV